MVGRPSPVGMTWGKGVTQYPGAAGCVLYSIALPKDRALDDVGMIRDTVSCLEWS